MTKHLAKLKPKQRLAAELNSKAMEQAGLLLDYSVADYLRTLYSAGNHQRTATETAARGLFPPVTKAEVSRALTKLGRKALGVDQLPASLIKRIAPLT